MSCNHKKLTEITRAEWIAFRWIENTAMGDEDRMFLFDARRTPDEAAQAAADWDATAEERAIGIPE
jgi:hypothetical protein